MNKVILLGNIVRDIEIKYINNNPLAQTAIAVTKKYKNSQGVAQEETLFIDINFWGRTADVAYQYLEKGAKVLIEGELKLEQWAGFDGTKRSKHVVNVSKLEMLGCKKKINNQAEHLKEPSPPDMEYSEEAPNIPEIDIEDDEIPF